jgi:D-alanyl-D-alanine carboxypeptidase (penicillin-binding protein 5/6)
VTLRSLVRLAVTLSVLASLDLLAAAPVPAQNGKPPVLNAERVLLLDADGKILFSKHADESHAPASLVKLMTLYLAQKDLEAGRASPDDPVTISAWAARTPPHRMGLRAGEVVPFAILLKGVAIASANDAATAVAEHLAGDEHQFVERMNAEAHELGLTATHFANPHGLPDPSQRSTANDLATLTARLIQDFPEARALLSGKSFTYRGKVFNRRIALLQDSWGVQALKTGFTNEAGYNLAVAAWRGGQRFLMIVLGAHSRSGSFLDAQNLLRYGFIHAGVTPPGQQMRTLQKKNGARGQLSLPPRS